MSVNTEIIYQMESLLSSVDVITDRETRTYDTLSTAYTMYNSGVTSILECRGTVSATSTTFVETTDYTLTSDSISFTGTGDVPDDASSFYVDYIWTRTLNVGEGYPCNPANLPYVGFNVMSSTEQGMNVGLFSSRGYDTVFQKVLVYITLFEGKDTEADTTNHYTAKELLNMTADAVQTKILKHKKLGDYIMDMRLIGFTGRRYDEMLNAYYIQMKYDILAIKEARF